MAGKKKTTFELMRAKILRERRKRLQVTKFKPKEKSICGRVAEFLNGCAISHPHSIITYEEITQAIFGLGRAPDQRSKYVKSVRGQMSIAGKKLMKLHNRTLITCRGVGTRASVDNADKLRETVTKATDRHRKSAEHLKTVYGMIDPNKLQEEIAGLKGDPAMKEEMMELAKWLNESMGKYLKSLRRPQTVQALLPPPPQAQ